MVMVVVLVVLLAVQAILVILAVGRYTRRYPDEKYTSGCPGGG
jgi:hypothetical protein